MNKTDYGPYSKTADDRTGERRRKPKLTKYHYFLFVFVLGVSFMLVSQLFSSPEKTGKDQAAQTVMSGRTEDKSGQKRTRFKASKDSSAKTRSMIMKETMKTS